MNGLTDRIEREIRARALLGARRSLVVAVSGGLDSMVLLSVLRALSRRFSWRLCAAHFNHQLRGRSSDADEQLVRATAARWKIPCVVGRADVAGLAARQGVSIEMAARTARHAFLAQTALRRGAAVVALAHHADDQVELFFLRLLRGAGSCGLAGMKWRNPSPANRRVSLVRPFLGSRREELADYARREQVPFRQDASNASPEFLRNRIRHELLPLLTRRFQPALCSVVVRSMELLEAEAELVEDLARQWRRPGTKTGFVKLPVALQRRVLHEALAELQVEPGFDRIEQFRLNPDQTITVRPGLMLRHDGAGSVVVVEDTSSDFAGGEQAVEFAGTEGGGTFGELRWRWRVERITRRRPRFGEGWEWFDADKIGPTALLRHWRPGDRFQPVGMAGPVKLQDLFINRKIPKRLRRQLVVAATAQGDLWWVEGLRIAEKYKLESSTRRRLQWSWSRATASTAPGLQTRARVPIDT